VSYTFVTAEEVRQMNAIVRTTSAYVPKITLRTSDSFVSTKGLKKTSEKETPSTFERIILKESYYEKRNKKRSGATQKRKVATR
jgi:hypothetical protein